MSALEMTPKELKQLLDAGKAPFILDVRGDDEYEIANIGGTLIPLNELPHRLSELDKDREIVVLCHHGSRSLKAVHFMLSQGFTKVKNLVGGINRWSQDVDPEIPTY